MRGRAPRDRGGSRTSGAGAAKGRGLRGSKSLRTRRALGAQLASQGPRSQPPRASGCAVAAGTVASMRIVVGSDRNGIGLESSVVRLSEADGDDAAPIARTFLETAVEGGRHGGRLDQIADIERASE